MKQCQKEKCEESTSVKVTTTTLYCMEIEEVNIIRGKPSHGYNLVDNRLQSNQAYHLLVSVFKYQIIYSYNT